jgi:chitinase
MNLCLRLTLSVTIRECLWRRRLAFVLLCGVLLGGCARPFTPRPLAPGRIVYGYYPWWEAAAFPPPALGWQYLTHVSHAFLRPTWQGGLLEPRGFQPAPLVAAAHAHGVRALLCVGGAGDSAPILTHLASNTWTRAVFAQTLAAYVRSNAYDGLELDWEFPRTTTDASNYVALVQELRAVLGTNLLLTLALSGSPYVGRWIDIGAAAPSVDLIILMTYDYHGAWSDYSGHNAPLHTYPRADGAVSNGVAYWLQRGLPPGKTLLGLAFFARAFNSREIGARFSKSWSLPYRTVPGLLSNGHVRVWDAQAAAPFLRSSNGMQVISYDDAISLSAKIAFAQTQGFAGVAVWQIAGDIIDQRHRLLPFVHQRLAAPLLPSPESQAR